MGITIPRPPPMGGEVITIKLVNQTIKTTVFTKTIIITMINNMTKIVYLVCPFNDKSIETLYHKH